MALKWPKTVFDVAKNRSFFLQNPPYRTLLAAILSSSYIRYLFDQVDSKEIDDFDPHKHKTSQARIPTQRLIKIKGSTAPTAVDEMQYIMIQKRLADRPPLLTNMNIMERTSMILDLLG